MRQVAARRLGLVAVSPGATVRVQFMLLCHSVTTAAVVHEDWQAYDCSTASQQRHRHGTVVLQVALTNSSHPQPAVRRRLHQSRRCTRTSSPHKPGCCHHAPKCTSWHTPLTNLQLSRSKQGHRCPHAVPCSCYGRQDCLDTVQAVEAG